MTVMTVGSSIRLDVVSRKTGWLMWRGWVSRPSLVWSLWKDGVNFIDWGFLEGDMMMGYVITTPYQQYHNDTFIGNNHAPPTKKILSTNY